MEIAVRKVDQEHRLQGQGAYVALVNRFLDQLAARAFSSATRRAYAYDLLNFGHFLGERGLAATDVVPVDLFDYLEWQARPKRTKGAKVVRIGDGRGAAPATMNRRIAAVRGLFEFAVQAGIRQENPGARGPPGIGVAWQAPRDLGPHRVQAPARGRPAGAPTGASAREP